MRCPQCGFENPPNSKFCGQCGVRLTDQTPASKNMAKGSTANTGEKPIASSEKSIAAYSIQSRVGKEQATELAKFLFEHIEGQINRTDTKAQLIMAVDALLAATITSSGKGMTASLLDANSPVMNRLAAVPTLLMFVALLLSVYYALLVIRPKLRFSQKRQTLFYFGHIVQWDEDEFIGKFLSLPSDEIIASILAQVYAKAQVAQHKFAGIHWSLNFLIAALILWAIAQLLLGFAK
jgi:hypothetical protein